MSLLKFVDRLKRINDLIKRERTGPAEVFASKVGISRSRLMENLREMKELGASIEYCHIRKSYYYLNEFNLIIGDTAKNKVIGGKGMVDLGFLNDIKIAILMAYKFPIA